MSSIASDDRPASDGPERADKHGSSPPRRRRATRTDPPGTRRDNPPPPVPDAVKADPRQIELPLPLEHGP
jgi:hypothetical protein